ncbi:hypothetical protein F4556_005662 [Kitasatospora gansuensis]|uniref:Uncharacterized protein n=1 Tax=Kitasatospora gansuensis TaxID=258050 RepID=A0A7W7WJS7_9ACTN|nr:hypothetical protein [Kitasatospora gansuensis]MBB4950127.1 hypothetical protein [Kitasatospora gansuensis]
MARRRLLAVCLALVVLGSPWVQELLRRDLSQNFALDLLWSQLQAANWWTSTGDMAWAWSQLTSTLVLLATLLLTVPRFVPLRQGVPALLVGCVGSGGLAGFLSALPILVMLWLSDRWSSLVIGGMFGDPVTAGMVFGQFVGLLLALALLSLATRPEGAPTAPRRPARKRDRSTVMAEYQRPNSTPLGSVPGDVTRYLSAAAYTDPAFARLVVEHLVADEFGAVATSPGLDLVPVARHSLAARALRRRRDLALAAVFGVLLLAAPLWLLPAWIGLRLLALAARDGRGDQAARGRSQATAPGVPGRLIGAATTLVGLWFALAVGLTALSPPGLWSWLLGSYLYAVPAVALTLLALVAAYLLTVRHALEVDARLRGQLRREVFRSDAPVSPAGPNWVPERLRTIAQAQRGNLTVYSGFNPFIGFAGSHKDWKLAVPLLPPVVLGHSAGPVSEFDVWDVLTEVRRRLRDTSARHSTDRPAGHDADLSDLILKDRVFANGAALVGDSDILAEDRLSPAVELTPEQVRRIALNPDGVVRHYLGAHLPLWGDDVVPSMFLHMSTNGKTLHIQAELRILAPVQADYHAIDQLPGTLTTGRLGVLRLAALEQTGRALFRAPRESLDHAAFGRRRRRRQLRELVAIEEDPTFDYGAQLSIREHASDGHYQNYFQRVDSDRAFATLTEHTLAAIREFLEAHGVDTADLRKQQQSILNHGVIQQGGISVVGNQAVGQYATATGTPGVPQQSGASAPTPAPAKTL